MDIFLQSAYLLLAILFILVQTFHEYYAIDSFNHLPEKWMVNFQNYAFCFLISGAEMILVLAGKHWLAAACAAIQVAINVYYYQTEKIDHRKAKSDNPTWLKWWIFVWLYPAFIALFSYLFHQTLEQ